ncbi:MAG: hypothetical protein JW841_10720 [Deltaproteobacteria bacterium]|nr:hypothetical protein [Deltaproteobacteria bacterium]
MIRRLFLLYFFFTQACTTQVWVEIACGPQYSCAINKQKELWCWGGDNDYPVAREWKEIPYIGGPRSVWQKLKLVGPDTTINKKRTLINAELNDWIDLSAGSSICAISGNGSLWCIVDMPTTHIELVAPGPFRSVWVDPQQEDYTHHNKRTFQGYALKTDGSLWRFIKPTQNSTSAWQFNEVKLSNPTINVTTMAIGGSHICIISSDGLMWCQGQNAAGQLGVGHEDDVNGLVQVLGKDWTTVSAGDKHTCALKKDNSLWCFGKNHQGQVGVDQKESIVLQPKRVSIDNVINVVARNNTTCAITFNGELFCFGWLHRNSFTAQPQLIPGQNYDAVAIGYMHTCIKSRNGLVHCFGSNYNQQLSASPSTYDLLAPGQLVR